MNEIIYLEPDEDITGVIAKVKEIAGDAISLVIPRGGTIAQSVVNLKLMKREIEKMNKSLSLVTKDKISKNLASQVGVSVYPSVSEAKNSRPEAVVPIAKDAFRDKPEGFETTGLKINQYSRELPEEAQEAEEMTEDEPDETPSDHNEPEVVEKVPYPEVEADDEVSRARMAEERHNLAHAQPVPRVSDGEQVKASPSDESKPHNVSSRRKPVLIISSVLLVILLAAGAVLYPSATVKMTLATDNLEDSPEIIADKALTAIDLEAMTLPAKEYVVEKSAERDYAATGRKDVGEKAAGTITFYNSYDNNNSIVLPNGTVLTAAGKTFLLDGQVTIPPAQVELLPIFKIIPGQITGKIVARDSGESSNVAPSKFLISSFAGTKQEKVYGQSTVALTGGTTRELKIISASDISDARSALKEELSNSAKEDLSKQVDGEKVKLVASSIVVTEVSYTTSKGEGEEAETFKATSKIKVTELGYSEPDLKQMVLDKINRSLKEDEMLVNATEENVVYDLNGVDTENGKITISAKFTGKVGKKFEAKTIQDMLVKSKYGNAVSRLEALAGVKEASVKVEPNFWPLLPLLSQRISVSFDYQKE